LSHRKGDAKRDPALRRKVAAVGDGALGKRWQAPASCAVATKWMTITKLTTRRSAPFKPVAPCANQAGVPIRDERARAPGWSTARCGLHGKGQTHSIARTAKDGPRSPLLPSTNGF